jgi:signal transduction histidine kinase/ligand-binding sensor domain-containing protein/DNA-binding NarL/FixJ family response regulator
VRPGILAMLLVAWLTAAASATAAIVARPLTLQHLTPADGLSQGTVHATLQDSQGFVWLATEDGLVRYDGHDLKRYGTVRTDPRALPGNFVRDLVEDRGGNLWVAIKDGGLSRWNRAADAFDTWRHDPARPDSLPSNAVRALALAEDGRVWVGLSDAGLALLDPRTGRFQNFRHDGADPDSLGDDRVNTLYRDRAGNLWIGTDGGLYRRAARETRFARVGRPAGEAGAIGSEKITRILEDGAGRLWVATFDAGLYRIDWTGEVIESFRHDAKRPGSLAHDDVRALLDDGAGRLWVGTGDGLDLLDRGSGTFIHYRSDRTDPLSLPDSVVLSLYQDAGGLVWIGMRAGGVSRWDPHAWELGGQRPPWLDGKLVTSFADAGGRRVWVGSLGGGLVRFDTETGEAVDLDALYAGRPGRAVLGDRRVMALHTDRQRTLWIGTMTSGLASLAPDGELRTVPVHPGDPQATSAAGIMTLFESRDGRVWIGTNGGGANVLDPVTRRIRQLPHGAGPGAVTSANVTAFAEDPAGNLWIATDGGGLDLARADGTVVKVWRHDPRDPQSLSSDTVYALAVDHEGRVWIGTDDGGLDQVVGTSERPDAVRFAHVTRAEGLTSDTVYGIEVDNVGHLWLSGNAGLMRFDPNSRTVKTYHREHGLHGEEFDYNAAHRTSDGRLCFGGPGGFDVFDPSRLSDAVRAPRLALTQVEVMGAPFATARPPWLTSALSLPHTATIVSLDFAALDFQSPRRNRIAYRLRGLTDEWIDLGTQRRVTLTNLPAGEHTLEVRAANADSVWSDVPLRLTIRQEASPWRTPLAYAAYVAAALLAIAWALRGQQRRLRSAVERQQHLQKEVAERTGELVESNRRLAEAARAKEGFLARMSHELRTPMNGVVGMTELLARSGLSAAQTRLTDTIRSSAETLLRILNDLLDLSKIDAGKVQLESLPVDVTRLVEESSALFTASCDEKGLSLVVCPPEQNGLAVLGDPLRLRQVLMNLIGNAVKFTAQGEIVVRADAVVGSDGLVHLQLSVTDTGIGIGPEALERVFEPFAQADETTTRRFGGTGLGLAICRELVALMGGAIRAESRPHAGSTFYVSLSLPRAHAESPAPSPLAGRSVRVHTRRPALREALERHLASYGARTVPGRGAPAAEDAPGELVIVDADTLATETGAMRTGGKPHASWVLIERLPASPTSVRLPVQRAALHDALLAAAGLRAEAPAPAPAGGDDLRAHVLIVEDDAVNAAVAQGYLDALGCTHEWVADGGSAVRRTAAEHFDLVLLDINLPDMDGYATARLIRERDAQQERARVPIVALTAHGASGALAACRAAGIDDVLGKPCTLEECAAVVRRHAPTEHGDAADARLAERVLDSPPAAAGADLAGLATIDDATLSALRVLGRDRQAELFARLVGLFETGATQALEDLGRALAQHRFAEAAGLCHKLKASAGNVGAVVFAAHVRELEQACTPAAVARALALHARLAQALPGLLDALHRRRLQATA